MKKRLKSLLQGPVGSHLLANYYRFVHLTSSVSYQVPGGRKIAKPNSPVIFTSWHGHSYLLPLLFKKSAHPTLLVARHGDGRMAGNAMNILGMSLIFGSGSTGKTKSNRGGAAAFLRLLKILAGGQSIKITADVPKISREVGEGIILLSRKSGVPILPMAIASSRRRFATSWDKMQINLPFSRIVFMQGDPILVPDDGSDLKIYQVQLQQSLESLNQAALEFVDR